jgi:probable rRNA maturation factor
MNEDEDPESEAFPEFPDVPDEEASLGEVILSYPLAMRQAGEHNVTVEHEVALLVVHGVLHLLGHDHAEPDEESVMKELEGQALARVFASSTRTSGAPRGG